LVGCRCDVAGQGIERDCPEMRGSATTKLCYPLPKDNRNASCVRNDEHPTRRLPHTDNTRRAPVRPPSVLNQPTSVASRSRSDGTRSWGTLMVLSGMPSLSLPMESLISSTMTPSKVWRTPVGDVSTQNAAVFDDPGLGLGLGPPPVELRRDSLWMGSRADRWHGGTVGPHASVKLHVTQESHRAQHSEAEEAGSFRSCGSFGSRWNSVPGCAAGQVLLLAPVGGAASVDGTATTTAAATAVASRKGRAAMSLVLVVLEVLEVLVVEGKNIRLDWFPTTGSS
jgi:hypothetical protein